MVNIRSFSGWQNSMRSLRLCPRNCQSALHVSISLYSEDINTYMVWTVTVLSRCSQSWSARAFLRLTFCRYRCFILVRSGRQHEISLWGFHPWLPCQPWEGKDECGSSPGNARNHGGHVAASWISGFPCDWGWECNGKRWSFGHPGNHCILSRWKILENQDIDTRSWLVEATLCLPARLNLDFTIINLLWSRSKSHRSYIDNNGWTKEKYNWSSAKRNDQAMVREKEMGIPPSSDDWGIVNIVW